MLAVRRSYKDLDWCPRNLIRIQKEEEEEANYYISQLPAAANLVALYRRR